MAGRESSSLGAAPHLCIKVRRRARSRSGYLKRRSSGSATNRAISAKKTELEMSSPLACCVFAVWPRPLRKEAALSPIPIDPWPGRSELEELVEWREGFTGVDTC
jgi:hypothetical protein